jgi:dTDP-4-dehydrorhamnose 3,5-epimerase
MKFTELEIPGLILVEPDAFADSRGYFTETFHSEKYAAGGIDRDFVQDNFSHSVRGVLRGLHFQRRNPQGKLVYVAAGEIFDVAVDMRRGSPAFGRWVGCTLGARDHRQLFVPEGCAHGFCVLSDEADVMYKCTTFYVPSDDQGIVWNDPSLGIRWPVDRPILSTKDAALPLFSSIPEDLFPVYRGR